MTIRKDRLPDGVMFNAYPDSCGGSLNSIVELFKTKDFEHTCSFFYILPSLFNSDLDRGFSIVDYEINPEIASESALRELQGLGIDLKLDFVLNHISVQSPQFRDLLRRGEESEFIDFFIDWNKFWQENGKMGSEGYIIPDETHLSKLFMRKPELPILKLPFPDGSNRFYWNTFYQKVTVVAPKASDLKSIPGLSPQGTEAIAAILKNAVNAGESIYDLDFGPYEAFKTPVVRTVEQSCMQYLGQMDLNAKSEKVWAYYDATLRQLRAYGAKIVRLDAFAYLHKEVGETNFFNEPGTWEYINRLRAIADQYDLILLPEIHSEYQEKTHQKLNNQGYAFYDFFFPGLVIYALETGTNTPLLKWIREITAQKFITVNMLGCHDGIPLLDMKGLLATEAIDQLIEIIIQRGGRVKNLYGTDGKKISYYQVNATFFSALDENPKKLLLARAIQMFMPGIPQIWYLDLFAGTNDYEAADKDGHKEINRTNLSRAEIDNKLQSLIVQEQLKLLRFRNTHPAFGFDSTLSIDDSDENMLKLKWEKDGAKASLHADLRTFNYRITHTQ